MSVLPRPLSLSDPEKQTKKRSWVGHYESDRHANIRPKRGEKRRDASTVRERERQVGLEGKRREDDALMTGLAALGHIPRSHTY